MKVLITSPCSASVIIQYGIKSWPIWECEPSKFQWNYDDKEICLIIEGQAKISAQNGDIYFIFINLTVKKEIIFFLTSSCPIYNVF